MSESLKDQLLKLGLAKQPPNKQKKVSHRRKKPARKRAARSADELSLDQAYRLRAKEEKDKARLKKEEKRLLDLERRRINKQVQEITDKHGLNEKQAEIKRNFMYKGRIRSVLCTPEQLRALNAGELGVVFLRGSYIIMAPKHVKAVGALSPDHVPDLGGNEPPDESEDDEHKVPDDLVW
ncbi:MAG: DUF2058 family protein [Xanthomonadales bacterium]|nr:DUF2058 domain-containing protein [Gammaproteobacteria bacterium]NNE05761.1 DUF2058 family protein [Xanthomonadales bacterium]NNL94734.1 DUF2058 family protein [Xanthomonadales bacterium]